MFRPQIQQTRVLVILAVINLLAVYMSSHFTETDFEKINSPGHNRISLTDFQNRELVSVYRVNSN